jgi:hypothetical protein
VDLRELTDRAEISDLLVRYTRVVDERRWDDYAALFAPGATVDYSAFGGIAGTVEDARAFLAETMPLFSVTQHMLGLPALTIDGDEAHAVTPCHNPMVMGAGPDAQIMVCALWYHHSLIRTDEGWRITSLREQRGHMTFLPGGDVLPS